MITSDISGIVKLSVAKYNEKKGGICGDYLRPIVANHAKKGISTYALIKNHSFSRGTLDSLKQNRNISTATLNDLCRILSCNVEDVLKYTPDEF